VKFGAGNMTIRRNPKGVRRKPGSDALQAVFTEGSFHDRYNEF